MDVFDRRRLRLRLLLSQMSAADLARASGVSASYISRCLREPGNDGHKTIGEITARKLEKGARKPEGWLDVNAVSSSDATLTSSGASMTSRDTPITAPIAPPITAFTSGKKSSMTDSNGRYLTHEEPMQHYAVRESTPQDLLLTINSAMFTVSELISSTDDLTRDQLRPLFMRLFDNPERKLEIVQRINATVTASLNNSISALRTSTTPPRSAKREVMHQDRPDFLKG